MTEVDRYLEAATRQNTQRSYASALRHFEVEWGGHLPATPDSVARYLAEHGCHFIVSRLFSCRSIAGAAGAALTWIKIGRPHTGST